MGPQQTARIRRNGLIAVVVVFATGLTLGATIGVRLAQVLSTCWPS